MIILLLNEITTGTSLEKGQGLLQNHGMVAHDYSIQAHPKPQLCGRGSSGSIQEGILPIAQRSHPL